MPKVKYVGVATIRKINKSDFQAVGVDDQEAVTFSVHNGFIAEVTDDAAAHLCTHDTFVSLDPDSGVSEDSKKAEKPITAWGGQEPDRPNQRRSSGDQEEPENSGQIAAGDAPTTVGGTDTSTPGDVTTRTAGTGRDRGTTTSPT